MHQTQLSDDVYQQAQTRANEAGFQSVEQYIADIVATDSFDESSIFTPEIILSIETARAKIAAGGPVYTKEEVEKHMQRVREDWIRKHDSIG